jgi:hypothetical protein
MLLLEFTKVAIYQCYKWSDIYECKKFDFHSKRGKSKERLDKGERVF